MVIGFQIPKTEHVPLLGALGFVKASLDKALDVKEPGRRL
jgi:hypothetical protein